jgi:hypothetical protein
MNPSEINRGLKRALEHHPAAALPGSPYTVIEILRLSHDALEAFVQHANTELAATPEACVSRDEMEKIREVYAELLNNFFPMAHTDQPIRELQIIERRRIAHLRGLLGEFMGLHEHARMLSEESRRITERTEALHHQFLDEFHQLIHA